MKEYKYDEFLVKLQGIRKGIADFAKEVGVSKEAIYNQKRRNNGILTSQYSLMLDGFIWRTEQKHMEKILQLSNDIYSIFFEFTTEEDEFGDDHEFENIRPQFAAGGIFFLSIENGVPSVSDSGAGMEIYFRRPHQIEKKCFKWASELMAINSNGK